MRTTIVTAALTALLGAACSPSEPAKPASVTLPTPSAEPTDAQEATPSSGQSVRRVDPRQGGFEIGFGEYAITLEAATIRPGPVTFVVHNGGKLVHGFEMESESGDDDNSGPGGGDQDGFKVEANTFEPGETIELDLDLAPGQYKIECFVANHDDLGMEILLEVRADAPKVRQESAAGAGDSVSIQGFAFEPPDLQIAAGTEVTWTNDDPTAHTVTADDGSFDSGAIEPGKTFSVAIDGSVTYFCAIHPTMKGSITVG